MNCEIKNDIIKKSHSLALSIVTTIALFADVESTGNLSKALNGDRVAQSVIVVILTWLYLKTYSDKNSYIYSFTSYEKNFFKILSGVFALFMIIGRQQSAHPDLKYMVIASVFFLGYSAIFYIGITFLAKNIKQTLKNEILPEPDKITSQIFEKHVLAGPMLFVFLCRLPYLIAFYPCSMSWDGGAQICNFYGRELFTNHHPPLLSFFYGAVAWYSQEWNIPNLGMFFIPLFQTTVSAFAIAKVCELFRYIKVSYFIRWLALSFYSAFSVWCIFDVTVIKDTLYYPFTMLFLIQIIYCMIKNDDFHKNKINYILTVIYGLLMMQTRNNGVFVLIFTVPFAVFLIKRKSAFIATAFITLVLSALANNVLYPNLGVINLETKEDTYCIMYQQTAKYLRVYPDDVTEEERQILSTLFDYEQLPKVYNPKLADLVKNCLLIKEGREEDPSNSEFASIKNKYFKVWFNQFLRHPISYIDTFLECSYGYYYPEEAPYKENVGFYEMDRNMFTNGMHEARQIEELAPARFLLEQIGKFQYFPGIGLLYRCGYYTWCVVFLVMYFLSQKRYMEIVVCIPSIVNILVCLISPVNTCIRYAMPTMCMVPLLIGLLWYRNVSDSGLNKEQK